MCVYSMVSDWGKGSGIPFREPQPINPIPYWPNIPVQDHQVSKDTAREIWTEFQKLLEQARKFDEASGQPDCESAEKTEWMKGVEERLRKLEES